MLGVSILEGRSVLMSVVQAFGNPMITALVACAVMMAVISTAVSLINSVGSNIVQDFKPSWNKKIVTLAVGIGAILCSLGFENILALLIESYEMYIVCLFIPIFMRLVGIRGGYLAATGSIGFGALSFMAMRWMPLPGRELIELGFSILGFLCGRMIEFRRVKNCA